VIRCGWDLCDADCFALPPRIETNYDGFPRLIHGLQGLVWRVAGTPTAGDLVSVAALCALCLYLWRRFHVPLAWAWLAMLAVPLVQIHLSISYVDLPANAGLALALLVALRLWALPEPPRWPDIALASIALAFAAGGKLQLTPVAFAVWIAIVAMTVHRLRWPVPRALAAAVALLLAGVLLILPQAMSNAATHGNPFFPVALKLGPWALPGPEVLQSEWVPQQWRKRPGWLRWAASVLEFDSFGGRFVPWTAAQGDVPPSSVAFRMGGYGAFYVVCLLVLLGWLGRPTQAGRRAIVFVVAVSLGCASLPLSHELRYYLFWMLTLVSVVLVLAWTPEFGGPAQETGQRVLSVAIAIALATVVLATGALYLQPQGVKLAALLEPTNAPVAAVRDGQTLCIAHRHRTAFLHSELFHPGRSYRTRAIEGDQERGCDVVFEPR